ncbi:TetR/AcrR family transcriptional regulator [Rhodococcus sp. BP-252]|uniref:ScbR family autoregulator-binding transcription factor n=1 Tax=unclassified Rhodococcus (in: high G+C Gram-positive bacteria) TaxID=192944 RepID=UPI0014316C05|nr:MULTISPECIES: ScbR family autoregulator-binding transcription factor [unclassified Rhodococcus (in: high G+C Gram-positive bacteria)]MBY6410402.1 TetR/AcrR family transcriptional regulator [Rhodococcus sp. BP-320]MBY6416284.1 TetR/AcrR family transcriptional regulator [Rhodococcus sp. BP-321]MBY6420279.1 TetR/AcrR family transcriptional regulator [Rhodococcus sp. BP-324]MBY6424958.1 TetR/AcrR family transcriptional regulator [Rhodococcus sp. BP-323]MBY6430336.1 TetR/AcrR family transcriptio
MQERAENTRQAVLVGAAVSFEKYGYGTASLSTILSHAGVTKGAMYFHFSSKEDLANAVIDAQHQLAMDGLRTVLDHVPTALDAMILASQELARQLVVEPVARGGMRLTLEIGSIQTPVKRPYIDWIESIGKLAARAAAEGDLVDGVDPEMLAKFVVGAFTGVQTLSEVLHGRSDLYQRLSEMWQILLPAVAADSALDRALAVARNEPRDWAAS